MILTFSLGQQRGDAVLICLRLSQLHKWQEETLQSDVERLQKSKAQAQALHWHICRTQNVLENTGKITCTQMFSGMN